MADQKTDDPTGIKGESQTWFMRLLSSVAPKPPEKKESAPQFHDIKPNPRQQQELDAQAKAEAAKKKTTTKKRAAFAGYENGSHR